MRWAVPRIVFSFFILFTFSISGCAQQRHAGKYVCLAKQYQHSPVSGPAGPILTITYVASALGSIHLDGRGNYRLESGETGHYALNASTGEFSFTSGPLQGWATKYEDAQLLLASKKNGSPGEIGSHLCRLGGAKASTGGTQPVGPGKVNASGNPNPGFKGKLTFENVANYMIVEVELATGKVTSRFKGKDPWHSSNGETVYVNKDGDISIADGNGATITTIKETDFKPSLYAVVRTYPSQPALSPDGAKVAYYFKQGYWESYVIVRTRDGKRVNIFKDMANPTWTPDGRLVMVAAKSQRGPKSGLFITDSEIKRYERVNLNMDSIEMPAVNPDGQRVAFVSNGHIWMANLDGSGLKQMTTSDKSESWPTWSPDGQSLVVAGHGDSGVVMLVPANSQTPVEMKNSESRSMQAKGRITWH